MPGPGPGMPPPSMGPTQAKCDQCNMFHPPVAGKCPMAKEQTKDGAMIDPSVCLRQLRTIIMSQIQQRGIKDHKKLYGHLVISLTKIMEEYSE